MSTSAQPRTRNPIAEFLMWAIGAGCVTYVVPWMTTELAPRDSDPWWANALTLGAWILAATSGAAGLMAGDRFRQIGAAIMLGGVSGAALSVALF
jgi:hypothetical protein